eukprot:495-Heterococcus_DN1.PRE.1
MRGQIHTAAFAYREQADVVQAETYSQNVKHQPKAQQLSGYDSSSSMQCSNTAYRYCTPLGALPHMVYMNNYDDLFDTITECEHAALLLIGNDSATTTATAAVATAAACRSEHDAGGTTQHESIQRHT